MFKKISKGSGLVSLFVSEESIQGQWIYEWKYSDRSGGSGHVSVCVYEVSKYVSTLTAESREGH